MRLRDHLADDERRRFKPPAGISRGDKDLVPGHGRAELSRIRRENVRGRCSCGGGDRDDPEVRFEVPTCRSLRTGTDDQFDPGSQRRGRIGDREGRASERQHHSKKTHRCRQDRRIRDEGVPHHGQNVVDATIRLEPSQRVGLTKAVSPGHLSTE